MTDHAAGREQADIEARMAQVTGEPRVGPVPQADLTDEQLELIQSFRRGVNSDSEDIPEFFRTIVKHPALFRYNLMKGSTFLNGLIEPRDRELAVLRIGWLTRAPYQWGTHVEISKRLGVTSEEIERVTVGSSAPGWTKLEAAILRGVEELLSDYMISDETWETFAQTWSEQQLMEFPLMVGSYVATAYQHNSYRIRLVDGNPGLSAR